jgi:hypothetical protein
VRTLRIHPAIGVARVGNSELFFDGPEHPGVPANWDPAARAFKPFKVGGEILRQAARFRIFAFDESNNLVSEVSIADGTRIEWRVHVANRKASFFSFDGQSGAGSETVGPYVDRSLPHQQPDAIQKPRRGRGQPEIRNLRNHTVANRRSLEIDPGEVAISSPGTRDLIDTTTTAPIHTLGRIEMLDDGSLRFLGGQGLARSSQDPAPVLEEYANNDGWFDDMCDGVIQATVTAPGGQPEVVESAWVIVGPPDFAPAIGNVVSLYDLLWDLAVREGLDTRAGKDQTLQDLQAQHQAWQDTTGEFAPGYEPSFTDHIYPILSRALAAKDVHEPPIGRPDFHETLAQWSKLSKAGEDLKPLRQARFLRIRNPDSTDLDRLGMPRGLGDEYKTLDDFESGVSAVPPTPKAFLSLTRVQHALLECWRDGRFKEDWQPITTRFAPIPMPSANVTPHGLDRAVLENCVGGPFFPGIEVSWLIRRPEIHQAAFRLKAPGATVGVLTLGPGFFSQQMALPWHADFYDCHREEHTPDGSNERIFYMWWTAQRPDHVRAERDGLYRRWVEPFDAAKEPAAPDPDDLTNLARFEQMRTRWQELSFVVLDGDQNLEQK